MRCSPDYVIVEASDGQSGLDLFRFRRIDCVVLELSLPNQSGFQTLVDLVPIASRPQVPVIVLTQIPYRAVWEVAKENGAYACFHKHFTTGADLDTAIQRAVAFVGQIAQGGSVQASHLVPEIDRYQPGLSPWQVIHTH